MEVCRRGHDDASRSQNPATLRKSAVTWSTMLLYNLKLNKKPEFKLKTAEKLD